MKQIRTIICLVGLLALLCASAQAQIPSGGTGGGGGGGGVPAGPLGPNSVNQVINIKASPYNASGSNQTMSCVANATQTMDCSGGGVADFVTGQYVKVLQAGNSTALSTPSQPTATWSCTGTNCRQASQTAADAVCTAGSNIITSATLAFKAGDAGREITVTGCGPGGATLSSTIYAYLSATQVVVAENPSTITAATAQTVTLPTHTYQYSILAIDAYPNGTATAPSTASASVTAPNLYANGANGTPPGQLITLSGYTVASGLFYAIYRSVDSGAYALWDITSASTFADRGTPVLGVFHGSDVDLVDPVIPGTTGGQPNAVFGHITKITGANAVTIATNGALQGGFANTLAAYPSTIAQSATVTVEHDDSPAWFAIRAALIASGRGGNVAIYFPKGDYNFNSGTPGNNTGVFNLVGLSNISFYGDPGWSSRLHLRGNRTYRQEYLFWDSVGSQAEGFTTTWYYNSGNIYSLVDPAAMGSSEVTIITPPVQATFLPGDPVDVFITGASYFGQLWNEQNEVVSYNATSGVVRLKWPLGKSYSNTAAASLFNQCGGHNCLGTPSIVNTKDTAPTTGFINTNGLAIRDLFADGPAGFITINDSINIQFKHLYLNMFDIGASGSNRRWTLSDSVVTENRGDGLTEGLVAAAGSADIATINNDIVWPFGGSAQGCEEGSSNVTVLDNRYWISGKGNGVNSAGPFVVGGGCFNYKISRNTINLGNTNIFALVENGGDANDYANIFVDHNTIITDTQQPSSNTNSFASVTQFAFDNPRRITFGRDNSFNVINPVGSAQLTVNGAPYYNSPPWASWWGDAHDGNAVSGTENLTGEKWYQGFECNGTITENSRIGLTIHATQFIQIDSNCVINGNAQASGQVGLLGGAGGGGGGGAGTGTIGNGSGYPYGISTGVPAGFIGGGAGGATGVAGSAGGFCNTAGANGPGCLATIDSGWPMNARLATNPGGASGGAGGSAGGAGGNGGAYLALYAPLITYQTGFTINLDGGDGISAGANSTGAGGGGGGGWFWSTANQYIGSIASGTITVNPGAGGSNVNPAVILHGGFTQPINDVLTTQTNALAHVSTFSGGNPTVITIDAAGANYATAPTCTIIGTGGGANTGSGATCTCTLSGTTVASCTPAGGNAGYGTGTTYTTASLGGMGGPGRIWSTVAQQ